MATEFGEQVLAAYDRPTPPITIDGQPMNDFVAGEREANAQGATLQTNDDGTPYDPKNPERGSITPGPKERPNFMEALIKGDRETFTNNSPFNMAHEDALITGAVDTQSRFEEYAANTTVNDEIINALVSGYNESRVDTGVLKDILTLPVEEQITRINYEVARMEASKWTARQAMLIATIRGGGGDMTLDQFEELHKGFGSAEIADFQRSLQNDQTRRLEDAVNPIVAATDMGTIPEGVGQAIYTDFTPIMAGLTRIGLSQAALNAIDVRIGKFRSILPGEVQYEIRKALSEMSPEQRIAAFEDIGAAITELKNGPYGIVLSEYGMLEQYDNIFTPELLERNVPENRWRRIFGNFDVIIEAVYGAMLVKAGGRGMKRLYSATNASSARQAAVAANNHILTAKLDSEIRRVAPNLDLTVEEASIGDLPRPHSLIDERTVLTEETKVLLDSQERIASKALNETDSITGVGINQADRDNVVRILTAEMDEISQDAHAMPKMFVTEELPNRTGVRITGVLGETPSSGWTSLEDLTETLVDLDPSLTLFRVMRRGATGNLEQVKMSTEEFARLVGSKGKEVPASLRATDPDRAAAQKFFQGRKLSEVSDEALLEISSRVPLESPEFKAIEAEFTRRAEGAQFRTLEEMPPVNGDVVRHYDGDEFFLENTVDHYWHSTDKLGFGAGTYRDTALDALAGAVPRVAIRPNMKFGEDLYGASTESFLRKGNLSNHINDLYAPFYKLSLDDKIFVTDMFEWGEAFGKKHERAPTITDVFENYSNITTKQLHGWVGIQNGLRLQYDIFDRRLFREFNNKGYKTASPVDGVGTAYHGEVIPRERFNKKGITLLDPNPGEGNLAQKAVLSGEKKADEFATSVDDIYNAGGGIIKVDIPLDVPNAPKFKTQYILVRAGDYSIGNLSPRVLDYHPGYYHRMPKDPHYVVKHTKNVDTDGVLGESTEAIATAGTVGEAERFIKRAIHPKKGKKIDPDVSYTVQRANSLNHIEGNLYEQQSIHRAGRLFWDKRNFDRLPDVYGNRSELRDHVKTLERATAMATRQTTTEDLMSTWKAAFAHDYGDLHPSIKVKLENESISEVIRFLDARLKDTADTAIRARYNQAIETAKYLRIQQGTDSNFIPGLRSYVANGAAWLSRMAVKRLPEGVLQRPFLKASRALDNYATHFDPFRSAKSAAYHSFIIFSFPKQRLLQGFQVLMLTALNPKYVFSGQIVRDSSALKRGRMALRDSAYADGWSTKHWADSMNMSVKEYERVVEEFDRSGLIPTINEHSIIGGATTSSQLSLPASEGMVGRLGYRSKQFTFGLRDWMQKVGFMAGESSNLRMTYGLALRRLLKSKGDVSPLKLTKEDWNLLAEETSNLAMAMIKPNKMAYQSGALGVSTQFISFTHNAALAMLKLNPALTKDWDRAKIVFGTYMLFGANMFGADDWAKGHLRSIGADKWMDNPIIGGATMVDILSGGIIQTTFNALGRATIENWQDKDIGFLAPGVNLIQIHQMMIENIMDQPYKAILGPFEHQFSAFMDTLHFASKLHTGDPDLPAEEKFVMTADFFLKGAVPQYNNAVQAYNAYTMGVWLDSSGKRQYYKPTLDAILARGVFGVRTEEEMTYMHINNVKFDTEENYRNIVTETRKFLKQRFGAYEAGEHTKEEMAKMITIVRNLAENWPDPQQVELFRAIMMEPGDEDNKALAQIMAEMAKRGQLEPRFATLLRDVATDMPPEVKAQYEEMLKEAYSSKVEAGNQLVKDKTD